MDYFTPLGEIELLSLHWNPIILLQAGSVEMHYTHMPYQKRGEGRSPGLAYFAPLHPVYCPIPDTAASPGQYE